MHYVCIETGPKLTNTKSSWPAVKCLSRIVEVLSEGNEEKRRYLISRDKATWKMKFKLPWCDSGPLNHRDDKVDSYQ